MRGTTSTTLQPEGTRLGQKPQASLKSLMLIWTIIQDHQHKFAEMEGLVRWLLRGILRYYICAERRLLDILLDQGLQTVGQVYA